MIGYGDDAALMRQFRERLGVTLKGAARLLDYTPDRVRNTEQKGRPLVGWRRRRIAALIEAFERGGWRAVENLPCDYSHRKGEGLISG